MAKYKLLLPKMGESVAEATIIKWNKNIGDVVEIDDAVIDIATDKVDSEVPSPVKGKLVLQLCKENEVVQVGGVLAIIETEDASPAFTEKQTKAINENHADTAEPVTAGSNSLLEEEILPEPEPEKLPGMDQLEAQAPTTPVVAAFGSRFYSPLVKNIAVHEGISPAELDTIPGTGADGRLTKDDILQYVQQRKPGTVVNADADASASPRPSEMLEQPKFVQAPVPPPVVPVQPPVAPQIATPAAPNTQQPVQPKPQQVTAPQVQKAEPSQAATPRATSVSGGDEIIEMDRMRRLIAEHMVASVHTAPHVTSFVEADVTNLVLWREKIKGGFEKREGTKITFTPIFIEAVTKAIKDFPMVNVSVNGTQIIKKKDINIGMAAALPSGNLIVPVIRKADELNLVGLSKAVNDLANRARTGKLQPDEIKDGTFTITNIGSFGNDMGTPIINQPQVAILAVGTIKKKPAVIETPTGDVIAIRHMMFMSLSYDHRVVDGALGGTFLRRVADYLEKWDISREI